MITRREMVKAGAGLAAILASGKAPAALVRSMLAARTSICGGKKLPYDAEVEYLESTGTQWIDTEKYPKDIGSWELTIQFTSLAQIGGNDMLNGVYGEANKRFDIGWRKPSNSWQLNIGKLNSIGTSDTKVHTFALDNIGGAVSVDGQSTSVPTVQFSASGYPILIGNRKYYNTGVNYFCKEKIFSSKMYDYNGILVRDLIPVRKDGVGEMYDRVTGTFAERNGNFVIGPDIVPVEYLESTGTQWIDTGIIAKDNIGVKMIAEEIKRSTSGARMIFGVYGSSNRYGLGISATDLFMWWNKANNLTASRNAYKQVLEINFRNSRTYQWGEYANGSLSGNYNTANTEIRLFAAKRSDTGANTQTPVEAKISRVQISEDSRIVRDFIPIRVGTDATLWEGAIMDVLNRRIYRNEGTGAFGYGNDKPRTANS